MYAARASGASGIDTCVTSTPSSRTRESHASKAASTSGRLRALTSSSTTATRLTGLTGSSGRPDMTASIAAVSAADRASGPTRSRPGANGITPSRETRPSEGAIPTTPHCEAGSRIDPPVSVPTARGTNPAATAAALPPELPPGLRRRSTGLRVGPWDEVCVDAPIASSSMLARPSRIAPASRR